MVATMLSWWLCATLFADQDSKVVNGGFEAGLTAWRSTGDVHLETNSPLDGKASARIGPGGGVLRQRVETGSGSHFTISATIKSEHTNGWLFAVRFLDKRGREVMRVDSLTEME